MVLRGCKLSRIGLPSARGAEDTTARGTQQTISTRWRWQTQNFSFPQHFINPVLRKLKMYAEKLDGKKRHESSWHYIFRI